MPKNRVSGTMSDNEKNEMISTIRRIAKELGDNHVPRHEFRRRSGISERKVQLLFGSYNALAEAAGLETRFFPQSGAPIYSDDDLLQEVVRVLRLSNSKLTRIFFEQHASVSPSVCERRFGGWINTLRCTIPLLDTASEEELIGRLREYTRASILPTETRSTSTESTPLAVDSDSIEPSSSQFYHDVLADTSSNIYGDFINFRGLQHAPVREFQNLNYPKSVVE